MSPSEVLPACGVFRDLNNSGENSRGYGSAPRLQLTPALPAFAELNGDKWFEDAIGAPLQHLLSLEEPPVSLLSPSELALSGE